MKTLNTTELKTMREKDNDHLLVNVLDEEKFKQAHIPGSENVPLERNSFTNEITQLAGGRKDKPIVVYCAGETCDASPKAGRKLEEAGFAKVFDYEGGIEAWKKAGLKINSAQASA